MISPAFAHTMARYNRWQNSSLYTAADSLAAEARTQNRGAFFGSIHATLAHILWADQVWMSRFAGTAPVSATSNQGRGDDYADWSKLRAERERYDDLILNWSAQLTADWLAADFTWSNIAGTRTTTRPAWKLVAHMFNHQTHHRGQAHAMLTSVGAVPEDTDLFLLPD